VPKLVEISKIDLGSELEVTVEYYGERIELAWFGEHVGHDLVPINGYGHFADECNKNFGHYQRCRRTVDHEGDCADKEPS
jgi:hypothetical protein